MVLRGVLGVHGRTGLEGLFGIISRKSVKQSLLGERTYLVGRTWGHHAEGDIQVVGAKAQVNQAPPPRLRRPDARYNHCWEAENRRAEVRGCSRRGWREGDSLGEDNPRSLAVALD
mgnify:CR=1 FL=1